MRQSRTSGVSESLRVPRLEHGGRRRTVINKHALTLDPKDNNPSNRKSLP